MLRVGAGAAEHLAGFLHLADLLNLKRVNRNYLALLHRHSQIWKSWYNLFLGGSITTVASPRCESDSHKRTLEVLQPRNYFALLQREVFMWSRLTHTKFSKFFEHPVTGELLWWACYRGHVSFLNRVMGSKIKVSFNSDTRRRIKREFSISCDEERLDVLLIRSCADASGTLLEWLTSECQKPDKNGLYSLLKHCFLWGRVALFKWLLFSHEMTCKTLLREREQFLKPPAFTVTSWLSGLPQQHPVELKEKRCEILQSLMRGIGFRLPYFFQVLIRLQNVELLEEFLQQPPITPVVCGPGGPEIYAVTKYLHDSDIAWWPTPGKWGHSFLQVIQNFIYLDDPNPHIFKLLQPMIMLSEPKLWISQIGFRRCRFLSTVIDFCSTSGLLNERFFAGLSNIGANSVTSESDRNAAFLLLWKQVQLGSVSLSARQAANSVLELIEENGLPLMLQKLLEYGASCEQKEGCGFLLRALDVGADPLVQLLITHRKTMPQKTMVTNITFPLSSFVVPSSAFWITQAHRRMAFMRGNSVAFAQLLDNCTLEDVDQLQNELVLYFKNNCNLWTPSDNPLRSIRVLFQCEIWNGFPESIRHNLKVNLSIPGGFTGWFYRALETLASSRRKHMAKLSDFAELWRSLFELGIVPLKIRDSHIIDYICKLPTCLVLHNMIQVSSSLFREKIDETCCRWDSDEHNAHAYGAPVLRHFLLKSNSENIQDTLLICDTLVSYGLKPTLSEIYEFVTHSFAMKNKTKCRVNEVPHYQIRILRVLFDHLTSTKQIPAFLMWCIKNQLWQPWLALWPPSKMELPEVAGNCVSKKEALDEVQSWFASGRFVPKETNVSNSRMHRVLLVRKINQKWIPSPGLVLAALLEMMRLLPLSHRTACKHCPQRFRSGTLAPLIPFNSAHPLVVATPLTEEIEDPLAPFQCIFAPTPTPSFLVCVAQKASLEHPMTQILVLLLKLARTHKVVTPLNQMLLRCCQAAWATTCKRLKSICLLWVDILLSGGASAISDKGWNSPLGYIVRIRSREADVMARSLIRAGATLPISSFGEVRLAHKLSCGGFTGKYTRSCDADSLRAGCGYQVLSGFKESKTHQVELKFRGRWGIPSETVPILDDHDAETREDESTSEEEKDKGSEDEPDDEPEENQSSGDDDSNSE